MNSINQNQPESNRADLTGAAAIERIKNCVDKAKTCFFCTGSGLGDSNGVRPMNVRQVDDSGNLWFLVASDSHTIRELKKDTSVKLYFQGSPHSDFLHLTGKATLSIDKAKIKELWEAPLKTWFTEGVDDPRIVIIKVSNLQGYYWDNKHGNAVAGVNMLVGAAVGKTLDDSIEGTLRV